MVLEATGMDIEGLLVDVHPDVYRPGDDTLLLARAVRAEIHPGDSFLEVGCGAGFVAMVAARAGAKVWATDLNPEAARLAAHNARRNGLKVEVREGDLLAGLLGPFDVVAFNPPYLPTSSEERLPGPLNLAFDGGPDGNRTVLPFARQVAGLATLPRCVLVVHSSLADASPLVAALAPLGYRHDVVLEESHFYERIQVERFLRG